MIPILYDKTGTIKLGELTNCIECLVEEERNGLFEVSLIYPINDTLFNSLEEENIIVCNANDTLLNQKFRIYMTRKLMSNKIEVFARHISFDLAYDYINNIDIENQSCEYALNTIFRNSQFSTNYKGYSDIINAQNYKISKVNCIEAIGGTSGSVLDTFGTGAEILRDNTNIHILNKRGHDNGVSIEYAKNLTGFELEEDYSELITRIIPFATYSDSETSEEVLVEANAVDSDLISNYSHPYILYMDFSEKFEDEEIPTTSKLTELAKKYFKENECDKPKQNFKIEFVPLSKCVGYEGIQDNISLCDTVTIKDTRYNIDTKAKVIKTVFNVLKNKYESMELGEPRTTLGDIINSSSGGQDGEQGPPGPQGPPGADGSIGDFPNSLPSTPVLSANVYGFASIELNWTYENKVYYTYELYGSKIKDFIPNEFDLIHAGQTSSYLFQAKPNETWYFRVCAVNTHGERTLFSSQVTVNTTKVNDLSNYVENQAIGEALIGTLSLDRGWIGSLYGNYIDAKQLSVTNGNGERTLDIDSYGNVNLNVNSLKISNKNVSIEDYDNNNYIVNSQALFNIEGFEGIGGTIERHVNIFNTPTTELPTPIIPPPQEEVPPVDIPSVEEEIVPPTPPITEEDDSTGGKPPKPVQPPSINDNNNISSPPPTITTTSSTKIHFINTGKTGDCILIQTDNNKNILIDSNYRETANTVVQYLKNIGVNSLDYIVVSHFHTDHAEGFPYIMDNINVKGAHAYYRLPNFSELPSKEVGWKTEECWQSFRIKCNEKGVARHENLTEKQRITLSDTSYLEFYNTQFEDYSDYNSFSLVVMFVHGNKKYLLTGDINPTAQAQLTGKIGKVDMAKVPHHGYNSTINESWVKELNPKCWITTRTYAWENAYNDIGMLQVMGYPNYVQYASPGGHIILTSTGNDFTLNTSTKFLFNSCWCKYNNDDSLWYWFKNGGNIAKNETLVIKGKKYDFNKNGVCTNPYNPR